MASEYDNQDVEMVPDDELGSLSMGGDATAKVAKLKAELKQSDAERKEYLDGWQRAKADLANFKKDEARRFDEFMKFAAEGVISEVVQVLDSFDLALRHDMPKDVEKGIVMIRSQLEDILRRRGLAVIPAIGQKFNPAFHEAIAEVESDAEEGVVAEELQKGYMLHEKVLRPARVKLTKALGIRH